MIIGGLPTSNSETRIGIPIGVLNDNVQGMQQQLEDHAARIATIGTRIDRLEASFAALHSMLEERLPAMQQP